MKIFSDKLRELRDNSGLLSKELAKELGISESKLSNYVNGKEPDFDTLVNISDYFKVSIDYLLGKESNNNDVLVLENSQLIMECKELRIKIENIKQIIL